jgi:adenine-specific DNA-methyltransferase
MPIKFIPYEPDTVEGQAVLNNFTRSQRVLRYREHDKVYERIRRGMPFYEAERVETVGNPAGNLVIRGECISACAYLKEQGIKVDLVYIDPPFASGADYAKKICLRRNPRMAANIEAAGEEPELDDINSFEEKMYGDIWQKEDYLNWMYENLMAIKSVMSDSASIFVHLDWHIGHYVKVLMDEVFGEENFINEIIWAYHGPGSPGQKQFTRKHDNIFWYARNVDHYIFNADAVRMPYHETTAGKFESKGTGFAGGAGFKGESGKIPEDWWVMPIVARMRNEIVGYSTQKPEKLLQRIIQAACHEGAMVADFFGGSGVAAKVAHDLGRNFIHADIGINSIQTVRDRLIEAGAGFEILEIQDGVSLFRNPQQTMDKLATLIPRLQRKVAGISNFWFGAITEAQLGTVPVYVPDLLNSQNKVLDLITINTIINQELRNLDVRIRKVIVYYVDIEDSQALEKFITENNATGIEIDLKDLKNLLHDIVMEDHVEFKVEKSDDNWFEIRIERFFSDRLFQKINEFNQKGNLQSLARNRNFTPISLSEEGLELIELISVDCENEDGEWRSSAEIKIDKTGFVINNGQKTREFWDGKISKEKSPRRLKVRSIAGDETVVKII